MPKMHKKHRGVPAGRNLLISMFAACPADGKALKTPPGLRLRKQKRIQG